MKKLTMVALAVLASVLVEAASRTFTVGFDADFPPYGYREGNEYRGFDLDLAREVCRRRGWNFVAKPINWDTKDMELNSGMIDCIWNGFTMQGRETAYTWTEAYIDNSQVVLVKVGSSVNTLADLAGKTVGVQTDTPVQKELSGKGDKKAVAELGRTFAKLVVTPNYNDAVMRLQAGAVDAIALDVGVARQKMSDKPGAFRMLKEIVMTETYGVGFKKGNTELRDQVQKTLKEMVEDEKIFEIVEAYQDKGIQEKAVILKP